MISNALGHDDALEVFLGLDDTRRHVVLELKVNHVVVKRIKGILQILGIECNQDFGALVAHDHIFL